MSSTWLATSVACSAPELIGERVDERVADHRFHDLLAHLGRLPHLREVVPHVVAVDGARARGPRADEIGAQRHDALHEQRAPVVTDEVDRFADRLDLRDQPVDVRVLGRVETGRAPAPRIRAARA